MNNFNAITDEQKEELLNGLLFLMKDWNVKKQVRKSINTKFEIYIDEISKGNKVV